MDTLDCIDNFNDIPQTIESIILSNNTGHFPEQISNIPHNSLESFYAAYLQTPLSSQDVFDTIAEDFDPVSQVQRIFEPTMINPNINQLNRNITSSSSQSLPSVSNLLHDRGGIDNVILNNGLSTETIPLRQNSTINQNQSTSVTPVLPLNEQNHNSSIVAMEMQTSSYRLNKISILSQPRGFYRPRTQNESKQSSHYIRCEEGDKFDYPTIQVPIQWAMESCMNIIEVTLVDMEKQPHPYSLENKSAQSSFENGTPIIKQNDSNILYFRLSNEDFSRGYKIFQMELIKSKQDEVITKKLIRLRKLDQSMLRFRRIFQNKHGMLQHDAESIEYSCAMIESYGEVSVEFISPKYSPMCGDELMFISLKGRFVKDDIHVFINTDLDSNHVQITKICINGNILYFKIPPVLSQYNGRINANVKVFFKNDLIHQSTFFYTSFLDHEPIQTKTEFDASTVLSNPNHLQIDLINAQDPLSLLTQTKLKSKSKPKKRLNN